MKNKVNSIFKQAYSFEIFSIEFNDIFKNPDRIKKVAQIYLSCKKRLRQVNAVKEKIHMTQLEKEWNIFAANSFGLPSENLIAVVADRLHALLILEYSKTSFDFLSSKRQNYNAKDLYERWAEQIDHFHLNEFYDLIKPSSYCNYCHQSHPVDIVWNHHLNDDSGSDFSRSQLWGHRTNPIEQEAATA